MGGVESKVNVEAVTKKVNANPVFMYSKDNCSYCLKAKGILETEKVEYAECNLDCLKNEKPNEYHALVNGLVYKTRQTTLPQIFICGKFIGGFSELERLNSSQKLWEAIAECT